MPFFRWLAVALLAGCASDAPITGSLPPPRVPLAETWTAGTRFRCQLDRAAGDGVLARAAAIWWREALRQTVAHELCEGDDPALPVLQLALDEPGSAVAAVLLRNGRERVLAGARFAGGDLPTAIDQLAWATRLAVGEQATAPVAVAGGTSRDPEVLLVVEDAMALWRDGGFGAAWRSLGQARARDGASPFVLDGVAALQLLRGEPAAAERTAREALSYEARLLPTTRHRLARTMLLARASMPGNDPAMFDRELLQLAEVTRSERPHDPQPVLSVAIALNFLGEFARARPLLTDLARRLPGQAIVDYHLGWACLGAGDPAAANGPFAAAALRLPAAWLLLPRAIALFEAGQHDGLRELLATQRADDANRGLVLDLLRLQAAHALLRLDWAAARQHLTEILNWLGKNPLVSSQRAGELAEQGALLVRLGGGDELPPLLAAIQQQHEGTELADVCAFLSGMATVHRTHERQPALEAKLGQGGDNPWTFLLAAYACELRGEIADMLEALGRAAQLSSSPMTKTLLARGLARTGRTAEADQLLATLRGEMRTMRLRAPCRHPLLGPELAFAFVASGP